MSLHDELRPPIKCKMCAWLATDPAFKAEWLDELARPATEVSHARIVDYLDKHYDINLDEASVRRHRRTHAA